MSSRNLNVVALSLLIIFVLIGCTKSAPVLKQLGPTKTKAGVGFNIQSSGESAIWTTAENVTRTTVIVWGETELNSSFGSSTNVTAIVPKELFSKPGQFQIYLLDKKTGKKSNSLTFTVEE